MRQRCHHIDLQVTWVYDLELSTTYRMFLRCMHMNKHDPSVCMTRDAGIDEDAWICGDFLHELNGPVVSHIVSISILTR